MYTIISGTNRSESNTIRVAEQYQQILADKGIAANLVSLVHLDVSQRNPVVTELEETILIPSEKIIFIAPEYNGSIPGVLKSLIDISDIQRSWWGKKALITGVSSGRAGNIRGMDHLTGILQYVKMIVHPNKLPISVINKLLNKEGMIADVNTLLVINLQLDEFISF